MKIFHSNLETVIESGALNTSVATLLQKHNEAFMSVQFASDTLNAALNGYATMDRETLADMFGIERSREHLPGSKFQIRSDHRPLLKPWGVKVLCQLTAVQDCKDRTSD